MTVAVAQNLSVTYPGQEQPAIAGVSFQVRPGEIVALVGESGSGKSTAARALLGLSPHRTVTEAERLEVVGHDVRGAGEGFWRTLRGSAVGYIPQDPGSSLDPIQTVEKQLLEALRQHRAGRRDRADPHEDRAVVRDRLRTVGLVSDDDDSVLRRYPHELSGGMRQRVLIAIAVANSPELLIADEPTSALDVTVQKQVLDHLQSLVAELGSGLLIITHDLGVAAERADRVLVMHEGRIVEEGPAGRILAAPEQEYTRALVAAAPTLDSARLEPGAGAPDGRSGAELLRAEGVGRTFRARGLVKRAAEGIDVRLRAGRTLGVVGESGSGKSTVARILLGVERPDTGRVLLDGHEVLGPQGFAGGRSTRRDFHRRVQIVYQNPFSSFNPRVSVERSVAEPLKGFGLGGGRAGRLTRARELLASVALPPATWAKLPEELSGGQLQRAALARALAISPDIVILDEAVSALDVSVQAQILQLLVDIQAERGVGYVFISHDLAVVRQIADDTLVMRAGRIVEAGPTEEIFAAPQHDYTRRLLEAIPRGAGSAHR